MARVSVVLLEAAFREARPSARAKRLASDRVGARLVLSEGERVAAELLANPDGLDPLRLYNELRAAVQREFVERMAAGRRRARAERAAQLPLFPEPARRRRAAKGSP